MSLRERFEHLNRMLMKISIIVVAVVVVAVLLNAGCAAVRAGYKSAPYQVVRSDGYFELRIYPALVFVETPVRGSNDSFMRLFRFIGGNNAAKQKNRHDDARVHGRARHECDDGVRDAGKDGHRPDAKTGRSGSFSARNQRRPVCRHALQRRAKFQKRSDGTGEVEFLD